MQTEFKIAETSDYILAVSDEAGKIGCLRIEYMPHKPHCYTRIYNSLNGHTIQLFDKKIWKGEVGFTYEIIAYQPKNNAPELDLPLLPEIVVKDKYIKEYQQYPDGTHVCIAYSNGDWFCDCGLEGDIEAEQNAELLLSKLNCYEIVVEDDVEKLADEVIKKEGSIYKDAIIGKQKWIEGYKSATKIYSEEDLRKAIDFAIKYTDKGLPTDIVSEILDIDCSGNLEETTQLFIQSLKQPKTPVWFEAEIVKDCDCFATTFEGCSQCLDYKTTTNTEGKQVLVGTYLFK